MSTGRKFGLRDDMPDEEEYVTPTELLDVKGDIILLREQVVMLQAALAAKNGAGPGPEPMSPRVMSPGASSMARGLAERVKFGKHEGARLNASYDNTPVWESRLNQVATTYGIANCLKVESTLHTEEEKLATRALIVDSIDNTVLIHLETAFSSIGFALADIHPARIFARLKENWTSRMADRTHLLQIELHNFILKIGEPITSFFERLLDLWTRLVAAKVTSITTGHMIEVVVRACARHDKFQMVCLQIRGTPNCTMDMARSMLTQWEELMDMRRVQGPPTVKWEGVQAMGAHVEGASAVQDEPKVAQGVTMEQVMEMMQVMMSSNKAPRDGGGGDGMVVTCYNCGRKGHRRNECKKNRIGDGFTFSPKALKKKEEVN
jgi:hypothetical protein